MFGVILSAACAGVNNAGGDGTGEAFAPGCAIRYHGIRMESYLAYRLYSIFEKMKSRNV
jgi:hypothetical protein